MMNISHNDPFRGLQQNISKIETIHNRKNRVHFFQNLQKKFSNVVHTKLFANRYLITSKNSLSQKPCQD
jgi:hypothetical protein